MSKPLERLKHHVTGAIERGEKSAVECIPAPWPSNIYSIEDLKKDYYRKKTNGHWFDKGTMRFFNSRISEKLLYDGLGKMLFFTSELGPNQARRMYSIREYNTETGDIETIGLGFQAYKTLAAAKRAAQYIIEKRKRLAPDSPRGR